MPYLICGLHLGMHCILLRGAFCNDPQPLEGVYFSAILLFLCKWSSLWFISKWFKSAAKGEVEGGDGTPEIHIKCKIKNGS